MIIHFAVIYLYKIVHVTLRGFLFIKWARSHFELRNVKVYEKRKNYISVYSEPSEMWTTKTKDYYIRSELRRQKSKVVTFPSALIMVLPWPG